MSYQYHHNHCASSWNEYSRLGQWSSTPKKMCIEHEACYLGHGEQPMCIIWGIWSCYTPHPTSLVSRKIGPSHRFFGSEVKYFYQLFVHILRKKTDWTYAGYPNHKMGRRESKMYTQLRCRSGRGPVFIAMMRANIDEFGQLPLFSLSHTHM